MGTFRSLSHTDVEEILGLFGLRGHQAATAIAAGTINTNFAIDLAPPGAARDRRFLRINEGKAARRRGPRSRHRGPRGGARGADPVPRAGPRRRSRLRCGAGAYVSLFPWVEGRTLTRFQVGPGEAQRAGRALAQLHRAGADFADQRPGRYEADEIERRSAGIAAQAAAAGGDPVLAAASAILQPTLATPARATPAGPAAGADSRRSVHRQRAVSRTARWRRCWTSSRRRGGSWSTTWRCRCWPSVSAARISAPT